MAALVCHPHPLFGGTMHNKVVYQAAKSLDALAVPVLRFNFRSAGMSGGTHDQGRGEQGDAKAALGLDPSSVAPLPKTFPSATVVASRGAKVVVELGKDAPTF